MALLKEEREQARGPWRCTAEFQSTLAAHADPPQASAEHAENAHRMRVNWEVGVSHGAMAIRVSARASMALPEEWGPSKEGKLVTGSLSLPLLSFLSSTLGCFLPPT